MSDWIPDGWHCVTSRLVADDPAALVTFIKATFEAEGEYEPDAPALLKLGDSIVMVSGVGPRPATNAFLYVYVPDVDATYRRALEAGARSIESPRELPYGDRRAMVKDPAGNDWQIATHRRGQLRN